MHSYLSSSAHSRDIKQNILVTGDHGFVEQEMSGSLINPSPTATSGVAGRPIPRMGNGPVYHLILYSGGHAT